MKSNVSLSAANCQALLEDNILSFWATKMVDLEKGGFYGSINGNDELQPDADKGIILNTRILWTFSAAYGSIPNPTYKEMADRAFQYIIDYFVDSEKGGVYWMLDSKGEVVDSKKQIYAQSFAIYAMSEYFKISKNEQALSLSKEMFDLIEQYSWDQTEEGYLEAFDKVWVLLDDMRLSEKDQNDAKTMNTHLHILEGYTNLFLIWPDNELKVSLNRLIELMLDKFVEGSGHFSLFFDIQWNSMSSEVSYGHDIEGGWLLHEAAIVIGDTHLIKRIERAAIKMTDAAIEGIDKDGGMMNEGDSFGVFDREKHWWPQAEALVGLVNAFEITKQSKYMISAEKVWHFINDKLVDRENGEWHWLIDTEGQVDRSEDKAGPWKCPYHNGRAMLEMMKRLKN